MPAFLKQGVNQWLCIALLALMCFWTMLYYMTNKAQALGESYSVDQASVFNN
jgi:hypothetical protein